MLSSVLVQQAAPTMAGLKSASLFSYAIGPAEDLEAELEGWNRQYSAKGICTMVLGRCKARPERVLLYTYRPALLARSLSRPGSRELLAKYGYHASWGTRQCLQHLAGRVCPGCEFPHEIGLFLSYPPEDVKGFIEHRAADLKYAGLWKVYGDEQRARDLFAKYQRCTEIYCERLHAGSSIAQLAVNVQQRKTAQKERMLPS